MKICFTKQGIMQLKQKPHLTLVIFFWTFMKFKKKGTGYVMGTLREWQKLVPKGEGHLMSFVLHKTTSGIIKVGITRNTIFFTPPIKLRLFLG